MIDDNERKAPSVVEGLGFVPEGRSETPARTLRPLVAAAAARGFGV